MTLYSTDPDVHDVFLVRDAAGGTIDFTADVVVGDATATATWVGPAVADPEADPDADPTPTVRTLRVDLVGLDAGLHSVRLLVPDDNDVFLGNVFIV